VGALLVLGGLTIASLEKQRNKRKNKEVRIILPSLDGESGVTLDANKLVALPFDSDAEAKGTNGKEEDHRPLLNMDIEMGRTSSSNKTGPERRR
jgi:hypothetical protein